MSSGCKVILPSEGCTSCDQHRAVKLTPSPGRNRKNCNTKSQVDSPCQFADTGLEGQWRWKTGENFDAWLKAVGVSYIARTAAGWVPMMEQWVQNNDKTITYSVICPGKSHHEPILMDQWFTETSIDGKKYKHLYWIEQGKLCCRQKGKKDTVITREVLEGGTKMVCTFVLGDNEIVAKRIFHREGEPIRLRAES